MSHVDLHCHTSASFDGVASPEAVVARAVERGLTHLAITDHDTIQGALRAVDAAPEGLHVIIGSEVTMRWARTPPMVRRRTRRGPSA